MPKPTHGGIEAGATGVAKSRRQYVVAGIASLLGTTIEWYDFYIYGTAAALIFNKIFFPAFDPITGTLASFATYSVGFFARPLGGLIFGHFGDRIGRKTMLLVTLLLMGVPTIAVGLIPSYQSIGYWAAGLLVLMRFLQGVAVGGEWGGAVLMAVEHAPEGKKGFFGSLPQTGVAPGLILSSLAMAAVAGLPEHEMLTWGWRVPFLASVLLVGVGWFIRMKVAESPDFEAMKAHGKEVKVPAFEVLKNHRGALLKIIGARLGEVTWFFTVTAFTLSYATMNVGLPKPLILNSVSIGATVGLFMMPLAGVLGDRIGHKRVFAFGAAAVCLFAFAFFDMLQTKSTGMVYLSMIVAIGLCYSFMYGPEGSLFSAQFPAEIRYSGISLGVQISGAIGGGLAPIVATFLMAKGHGDPQLVSWYLGGLAFVALLCALSMRSSSPSIATASSGSLGGYHTPQATEAK
ncbi:shikimate transporter ShiA [Paraburkholderia caribensis MBA4]|uniref:Shikimate transporter ShiA n=1 Tax=Paraburkholderia caribensis MBA4 TaxID=1323664 RepID=A0A0P0RIL6_9BURK|nr:MFS transporter [Paraburkholderia caribensis]ALL68345.1 shikimate transporter ShiA [Paraburkholderia caribensis MBA4]